MIIGLAQMNIVWENKKANIQKINKFVECAVKNHVELILFPEMALSGFTMNVKAHPHNQQEVVACVADICMKYSINIGLGYGLNIGKDKALNKYAIISSSGNVILEYEKLHLFSYANEDKYYCPGNAINEVNLHDLRITAFICYDLRFPEIFQIASKKSNLIIVAANWPIERENHWISLLTARAIENQCFFAAVNRVGLAGNMQYPGLSMIINPNGDIITKISRDETLIVAQVNIDEMDKLSIKTKKDRRESFYYGRI